jgi:FkbM family methyltransferase
MIRATLDAVLRRVGPRQFTALVNDQRLLLPRELRGLVGVDRAWRKGIYFERPAMLGLQSVLKPGAVVFDVGCSYGLITCLISKAVGDAGIIHSFEANGDALAWARRVAALNCPEEQVQFIHACVGESSMGHATFFTIPGSDSVASTRNPDIRQFHGDALPEQVPLLSLDDYTSTRQVEPACLKIDVEGSECLVLRGARRLLERAHPALVIETHGLEIDGIGGSVRELVDALEGLGYTLTDLAHEKRITPADYARLYHKDIGYLLAAF